MRVAGVAAIGTVVLATAVGCAKDGGVAGNYTSGTTTKRLSAGVVGECFYAGDIDGGLQTNALAKPCPDAFTPYELAWTSEASQPCPDGKRNPDSAYAVVDQSGTKQPRLNNPAPTELIWCFALNVIPQACYHRDRGYYFQADCAEARPEMFRAVSQVDGSAAPVECGPGEMRYEYPKPVRVVCLAPLP